MEVWKNIKEYPNYLISNYGNVKSLKFNKEITLKPRLDKAGYKRINLFYKGKSKTYRIHILVANAFLNKIEYKNCVNHIDGNKKNNHYFNLEWCNYSENNKHAIDIKLRKVTKGEMVGLSKLTDEKVSEIKKLLITTKLKQKEIANLYNVHCSTISYIKCNRIWKHIN